MSSEIHAMTHDHPTDLSTEAGEYVLGTLSRQQRHSVQLRLPHEPALQEAVDAWETCLHPLTALVEPVQPSAAVWQRITNSIASSITPPQQATPQRQPWWSWHSLALWRSLAGAGLTSAAVLSAMLWVRDAAPPATPRYLVVLAAPQNQVPGWLVQAQDSGQLQLLPLSAERVPAEKTLQFWTKADSWSAPVSLGLVQPGEAMEVPVNRLPPLQANQLFELTLEPAGGSPTGRPTGPIQFIGRAVQI